MSPSTFQTPSTRNFPGQFPSSPSSAKPASYQPSNVATRRLAPRPRVASRFTKITKTKMQSKNRQFTAESLSEPHHTAGPRRAQSSSDDVQESIPLIPSDSGETGETPDGPRQQPHNNGGYSSSFTPYTAASGQDSLWNLLATVVSPSDRKLGKIYVYRDPNREDSFYKIGTTTRDLVERMNEHKRCCAFDPHVLHLSRDIDNSGRLEKLIGRALANHRMVRHCSKLVNGHDEWFQGDKNMLIETVDQFVNFMDKEQPYDAQGNLTIIWRYLLRKRSPSATDVRKLCAQTRTPQWAAILASPTYEDYAYAYLSHAGSELRRLRGWRPESYWKLSTVIYSLWTLALSRNVVAFYALVLVLGCAGNTLIPEAKHKERRRSSYKNDTL